MRVILRRIATIHPLITYYKWKIANNLNNSKHKALASALLGLQRIRPIKSYFRKLILKIQSGLLPVSSRTRRKVLPVLVQLVNYRGRPNMLRQDLSALENFTPNFVNRVSISKKTNYNYLSAKLIFSTKRRFLNTRKLLVRAWDTNLTTWSTSQLTSFIKTSKILSNFFLPSDLKFLNTTCRALQNGVTSSNKLLESSSLLTHYFSTIDLRRDYILAAANIALTYNLYHPFFTHSIINQLRKSNLPWIKNTQQVVTNPLVLKLLFNFRKHYLYITLFGRRHNVFFSIGTSLFLKFVNYKKSLKKSYSLKLLLIKYLRKLLLVSNLTNFYLYVRHTSAQLNKFLQLLQKPFNHSFTNPLTGEVVEEGAKNGQLDWFNFQYMIFLNNKPYGFMKTKKTGRLKRKIRRRLVKLNRITD